MTWSERVPDLCEETNLLAKQPTKQLHAPDPFLSSQ